MAKKGLLEDKRGRCRCWWAGDDPLYVAYHDREWGVPVKDDHRLFEKLCLEGFQSGLSWLTILRKREAFRQAFDDFDPLRVSRFGARRVKRLLQDAGIVRHRGKIEATIHNAGQVLEIQREYGSFAAFVWRQVPPDEERPKRMTWTALQKLGTTPTSQAFARTLKGRGFKFVGPTTVYAFMQAMGLVNDHLEGCFRRDEVALRQARFHRPG